VLRQCRASPDSDGPAAAKAFDLKINGRNPTDAVAWAHIVKTLKAADVAMLPPQQLAVMRDENGMTILDVRPCADYEKGFISGAVNVPLYQPIRGWDPYSTVRRVGFALFGITKATEPNPRFLEGVTGWLT